MSLDKSVKSTFSGAGLVGRKVCFEDLNKDISVEVPNAKCSYILCLLGYISYGVHLRNNMLMFEGKHGNGPACICVYVFIHVLMCLNILPIHRIKGLPIGHPCKAGHPTPNAPSWADWARLGKNNLTSP